MNLAKLKQYLLQGILEILEISYLCSMFHLMSLINNIDLWSYIKSNVINSL